MDAHLAGSSSRRITESLSESKRHGSGKFCVKETTTKAIDRKKYPIGADGYVLYEEVGHGVSASVYRALCLSINEIVAIKILDFERTNSDLTNISREAQTMMLMDHDHLLCSYCSFVHEHSLWVVMPYMAGGSCLHVLQAAYSDGFEEPIIATILWQTLKGLVYLHHHGQIHRDVKAGNILIDANGIVKLGDFGISASLFDSGNRQRGRNTFAGTPCWMAPEVMDPKCGYDLKADIWSFGITALELAHGHAPFSKYPPMKVLLMTLQNAPPGLDYERDKKFSKLFRQMIAVCLVKDPSKRPSATKLARHPFFRQAKSSDYIARTILDGLPELGERLKELKLKEENLVAQKKMPNGIKEELSLSEYKRGISGWNFNMEDIKAQASLIQDAMESMPEYEQSGSSNCSCELGLLSDKEAETQLSFPPFLKVDAVENEDDDKKSINLVTVGSIVKELKDDCWGNSFGFHIEDDNHPTCDGSQHSRGVGSELELEPAESLCKVERINQEIHNETSFGRTNHIFSEIPHKGAKLTVSKSDVGEKPKGLDVVEMTKELDANDKSKGLQVGPHYLKGRFKVTENIDKDKVASLQKSHSMQIISQHQPSVALGASDGSLSNHIGTTNMSQLHTMFQSINSLRDNFIVLMKQMNNGQMYNGELQVSRGANEVIIPYLNQSFDKSLQEAMKSREKELLQEIKELNGRLACAYEELEKLRANS